MTVNMDKDYEDLYTNLNSLLKDICTFLETKSLHLSPADKKNANTLIERSQKHLQIIEKFTTISNENNCCAEIQEVAGNSHENESERYVDMTKKTVSPQRILRVETTLYQSKCPFQDLPAKEASQEIKYGTLTKRRKVLNIIEVSTKIYAAIHKNWLLLYNSSKDLKPDCTLDLKQYAAKEDESDPNLTQVELSKDGGLKKTTPNLKMTSSFKVFDSSSSSQKKCYSFIATTHKDMLQWVVNINRCHDKAMLATKYIHEERNYEICQDFQDAEEEENIYNEIEMPSRSAGIRPPSLEIEENDPPAIPEKRPIVPKYILPPPPISPNLSPSIESMVSYEELDKTVSLQSASKTSSLDSFEHSEDEDRTYYELDTVKKRKSNEKQILKENDTDINVPKTDEKISNDDDDGAAYENRLSLQISQSTNKDDDLKSEGIEMTFLKTKLSELNKEVAANPCLTEENSPKPIIIVKPKIISPKPWKPFKKSTYSKNCRTPQISKNRPIRESLTSQKKTSLKESSSKNILPSKENSTSSSNDCSNTSTDISSLKPNQGSSIVQIIRSKWSTNHSSSCSLETFSRNSKIETFQASPTKETTSIDSVRPIDSLLADITRNGKHEGAIRPIVLLKPLEEGESPKKLKKSPVVPVKPKQVAKKLPF